MPNCPCEANASRGPKQGIHLQYGFAASLLGQRHVQNLVEAARPQERGVNHVGAVGGCHYVDALAAIHSIHLGQKLQSRTACQISRQCSPCSPALHHPQHRDCFHNNLAHSTWLTTRSADWLVSLPRRGASASISSKNNTHGAAARALEKSCRTARSLSPTYLLSSSGPLMDMKFAPDSFAAALATSVFPHPAHQRKVRSQAPRILMPNTR